MQFHTIENPRTQSTYLPQVLKDKGLPTPVGEPQFGLLTILPEAKGTPHYERDYKVSMYLWGDHVFVGRFGYNYSKVTDIGDLGDTFSFQIVSAEQVPNQYRGNPPQLKVTLTITAKGGQTCQVSETWNLPSCGVATLDSNGGSIVSITRTIGDYTRTWTEDLKLSPGDSRKDWLGRSYCYDAPNDPIGVLACHIRLSTLPDGVEAWWERLITHNPELWDLPVSYPWQGDTSKPQDVNKGLTKALARAGEWLDRLKVESYTDWWFFHWLRDPRTQDKRCNNNLLATLVGAVSTYEEFQDELRQSRLQGFTSKSSGVRYDSATGKPQPDCNAWQQVRRDFCLRLKGVAERETQLESNAAANAERERAKGMEALGVNATVYPKLAAKILDGSIPLSVFIQPDKQPVNREWPIWEKALAREGWAGTIAELATDAARHSTYEKDVTPYLNFLFRIEAYLDKHAPRQKGKWKAMPKYVKSQWELEMDEPEDGTVKRRSAFTPVADNDTGTITVPYVAVCVSGVRTQWCYARHYHVFEDGFTDPESGGIVVNGIERKLNGRDDYGLMYYTLTGTVTARGYPTFLIIFEKRHGYTTPNRNGDAFPKTNTFVHFHRVRPCRSKDGVTTPACQLIEACYQYMAGNVPASDIVAQQGDLMFIRCSNDPIKSGSKVAATPIVGHGIVFESHRLESLNGVDVTLWNSEAKQPANRLGFVHAPAGMKVLHPEHEDIQALAEGWWEIRRARSFEANPVAIWSLTID